MDQKLAQLASVASQKDKANGYLTLLNESLAQSSPTAVGGDVHTLVEAVVTQDHVGLVVGRQVLSELVKILATGGVNDRDVRKKIIEDTLAVIQPRIVSYDEQVGQYQNICPTRLVFIDMNRPPVSVSNLPISWKKRRNGVKPLAS